jgi:hypothetical protein
VSYKQEFAPYKQQKVSYKKEFVPYKQLKVAYLASSAFLGWCKAVLRQRKVV